ncbi:hypothetical protein [Burkholderia glumae]|uniref:hypothetical protein n=1 Tax=Burkholderia glumae TaxID=337 RepID=UPI00148EBFE2|nr:hypothetical protein [Burkholderia glumae]QJW79758.1 hypothetical protein GAS18_14035 [Burkholderia glumae]
MAKRTAEVVEVTKYCDTVRLVDHDIEITNRMQCDSAAGACLTRAEQLRALTVLVSGGGLDHFDGLSLELKDGVMTLLSDIASDVANLAALAVEVESVRCAAAEVQNG